jgi:Ser/Thr protein kinase RdoA (MazF antagonist)
MADIHQSTAAYERWLRLQLAEELAEADLAVKHGKMREGAFAFLRATYWRWAETVLILCPEAADCPCVLAVGDIHLENFGTWRDADGRLVWGVNDFDEAAEMPYVLDLLRLAASALLAGGAAARSKDICASVLAGYRAGLAGPRPIVLDRDFDWLRALLAVSDKKRSRFWRKLDAAPSEVAPLRFRTALEEAMPESGLAIDTFRRQAGVGSLGRPRWAARAEWRGAPVIREAKALVPSAWSRAHGNATAPLRCAEAAGGRHRAPDPWYRFLTPEAGSPHAGLVVRRLSPNNRKIEADDEDAATLLSGQMLGAMGLELANVHAGTAGAQGAIEHDLQRRKDGWLAANATAMAAAVERDFADWKVGRPASLPSDKVKKQ